MIKFSLQMADCCSCYLGIFNTITRFHSIRRVQLFIFGALWNEPHNDKKDNMRLLKPFVILITLSSILPITAQDRLVTLRSNRTDIEDDFYSLTTNILEWVTWHAGWGQGSLLS